MINNYEKYEKELMRNVKLEDYLSGSLSELDSKIVMAGDLITSEEGFMHGSGTIMRNKCIYSCIIGRVTKTNRLLTVNSIKQKYTGNVGDVVVGVIKDIKNRRWEVDIKSSHECILNLNSIHLEEQRIKTEQDEFNMVHIFQPRDIICAEVHSINNDKTINLHTRSLKYGKLNQGMLLNVDWKLIKRIKKHFLKIHDINIILAHNGNIWLSYDPYNSLENPQITEQAYIQKSIYNISLLANIIKILNSQAIQISISNIEILHQYVSNLNLQSKDLNVRNNQILILQPLLEQIKSKIPTEINKLIKQGDYLGLQ